MPSQTFRARPSGHTSTSLAVKSVSRAELAAHSSSATGPVTSRSCSSGAEVNTSTSLRRSTGRWSKIPGSRPYGERQPPRVGTGSRGSYAKRSAVSSRGGSVVSWPLPPRPLGAGERPFVLVAPGIVAHHEQADRWLLGDAGVFPLEPVVQPPQLELREIDVGVLTEVDLGGRDGWTGSVGAMNPRADDKALPVARLGRRGARAHAEERGDRPLQQEVVPAGDVERWSPHLGVVLRRRTVHPIAVPSGMVQPLPQVRGCHLECWDISDGAPGERTGDDGSAPP